MKQIIKGIFQVLNQREKGKLLRLTFLDLAMAVLDIAFLAVLLLIINFYTTGTLPKKLNPYIIVNQDSLTPICIFLLFFALKNCLGFWVQRNGYNFFYDVASRLSGRNVRNYLRGHYTQFVDTDSSVQVRRISHQPIEFSHYLLTNLQQVLSQSMLILFSVIAIVLYHPGIFLALLLLLSPALIGLNLFIRSKVKTLRNKTKAATQKSIQYLNEALSGYVESTVYQKGDFFSERYLIQQKQVNGAIAGQQTWQALPGKLMEIFVVIGFLILVAANKYLPGTQKISVLTIGVFVAAAYKIIPGLVKLVNCAGQMQAYSFVLDELIANEALPENIVDEQVNEIRSVEFDNISFSYKTSSILANLDFSISSGEIAGLSAHSGRGKTTIINLLMGFLQQDAGSIGINGQIENPANRQAYFKRISLVKQQPFFIHDSIRNNITLNDEVIDNERIEYVINFCGLMPLLLSHPEGIHHLISENGRNLSGGQRQRLMLARALYHDFDLLILDEPFSEMDKDSETELLSRLKELTLQGKMVILITHNKESLAFCDKVITLDPVYA